jgi:hypothetical protein
MERSAPWLSAFSIAKKIVFSLATANSAVKPPPTPAYSPHSSPNFAKHGGDASLPMIGPITRQKKNLPPSSPPYEQTKKKRAHAEDRRRTASMYVDLRGEATPARKDEGRISVKAFALALPGANGRSPGCFGIHGLEEISK